MKFHTADEAFNYIESFINLEKNQKLVKKKYNLHNMFKLCKLFDNPQKSFHSIHVAGSKGKGSTAAFIASTLSANGIKTGLFTSPHVESYKERIKLADTFFDEKIYIDAVTQLLNKIDTDNYTTFELLTILSFLIFRMEGCKWAVFETGLGGRLDATNVILPEASILTIIELEHTEILGKTIKEIAYEKAGIIKEKVPVFSTDQCNEAEAVFKQTAKKLSCPIFFPDDTINSIKKEKPSKTFSQSVAVKMKSGNQYKLDLKSIGQFQIANACLALSCLEYLSIKRKDIFPKEFHPSKGMGLNPLPGRCEILNKFFLGKENHVFLDGAHTEKSIIAAANTFFEIWGKEKDIVLIFGAVEGKDIFKMAHILLPLFKNIIISKPGSFKPSNPKKVYKVFLNCAENDKNIKLIENPKEALSTAIVFDAPIFVTGSFYMVSEIRKLLV